MTSFKIRLPESPNDQIEWFHALSALPAGDLLAWATSNEVEDLSEFVRRHLIGLSLPAFTAPADAVNAVALLRENELAWNRELQQALIRAEDLKTQSLAEARGVLVAFATGCPWVGFKEVAQDQAAWY